MAVNPVALAALAGGSVFLYSALVNKSALSTIQSVIKGQTPKAGPAGNYTPNVAAAGNTALDVQAGIPGVNQGIPVGIAAPGNSAIASDIMRYDGYRYVWGASGPDTFDCSGLVNWVCGHDLGLPIPGYSTGKYSGHGPPTGVWFVWTGLETVTEAESQPGDIIIWLTHMGVLLGNGQMISALDTNDGVKVTTIAGGSPGGEPSRIGRYK